VYVLLLIGVGLVGASAALIGRAIALPRLRALERVGQIGAYGFAGRVVTAESPRTLGQGLQRLADPVGRLFARRMRGLSEDAMRRELIAAGMYRHSPATLIGYRVLATVGCPAVFVWFASTTGVPAVVLAAGLTFMPLLGWLAPLTMIRRRARLRLAQIDYELPELVDLLVVTVESGMGFAGSMQTAAERFKGPLGEELRLTLHEQSMGLPADQALQNMLERADTDGMRSFVRSVRQGESLGVSIGQIMRNLADEMRSRRRANAEERAQKAPIKIMFPLVALIFPAIFVVLLGPAAISLLSNVGGGG
jgi:tight adherence protein C